MAENKKPEVKITEEDIRSLKVPKVLSWQKAEEEMTEEEIEKIKKMNWEWYYNCYIYLDSPTPVSCKRCGHINIFMPGEKTLKCENCGTESKRCEVEEDLGDISGDNENDEE
jgi:hypothetical protein